MTETEQLYCGTELGVFAQAVNWKSYYRSHIRRYIRGDVLEVGAGLGGTTTVLFERNHSHWVCLEPDPTLASQCAATAASQGLPVEMVVGDLRALPPDRQFDCILYIDVLEHIEHDREELHAAIRKLRPGGHVVVLSPAHNRLFTEFDRAIGHFRRYNRAMLRQISPGGAELVRLFYLDAVGMLLSLGNRLFLNSGHPTAAQIRLWDKCFVPCSRLVDPLLGYNVGKTVVGVWRAPS